MSVSHSTEKPRRDLFPALRIMESRTQPLRYGREPHWRAPVVVDPEHVYTPTWDWTTPRDLPENAPVTVLHVTAACLDAMGSDVKIAHAQLKRTGPLKGVVPAAVNPGYYKITVPYWAFSGTIVHPLGNGTPVQLDQTLWIAAPTLVNLLTLSDAGHLGYFKIIDSYTSDVTVTFTSWSDRLGSIRREYMDRLDLAHTETDRKGAQAHLDMFDEGYAAALSAMLTGERCKTHRPDWAHTIYAQAAVETWRKAWQWTTCSKPLVSMSDADEIAVLSADILGVLGLPKPPFRYDPTGRVPGAMQPQHTTVFGCEPAQRADSLATIEDAEDDL
ncbi:hypothetical protein AB0451_39535 [Streptomyces sp. NPDC052000]|uniref:hypothetical protein n=1 Tax=Streptomyces sp. NPDC052000 TaxID=3155676 RepID=UPI00344CB968